MRKVLHNILLISIAYFVIVIAQFVYLRIQLGNWERTERDLLIHWDSLSHTASIAAPEGGTIICISVNDQRDCQRADRWVPHEMR